MPRPETAVALDRYFVRSRGKEGRDDNPLNDVRMIANPITRAADPARSVLKYRIGDKLSLTSNGFARLAIASFAGIERNTSLRGGKRGEFQPERLQFPANGMSRRGISPNCQSPYGLGWLPGCPVMLSLAAIGHIETEYLEGTPCEA
jgi:hypothetical protein